MTKKYKKFKKSLISIISIMFILFVAFWGLKSYSASNNNLNFIQVSDVHLSSAKINKSYRLTAESGVLFEDVINQINETPNINFVMFTGDMIDNPRQKELIRFISYANNIRYPWYAVLGNHDICVGGSLSKEMYWKILNSHNKNFNFTKTYYSFYPKKGFKVIGLDLVIDDRISVNGEIDENQLKWLDKELSKSKKDVVLIFLHYPLIEPFPSKTHKVLNADKVLNVIHKYKNPIAIFTGHYHTTKIYQSGNILHVNTPAIISYPNAFRLVKINNQKNKVIFDFYFKETRLKNLQKRAKMLVFGAKTYYGTDKDRTTTYIIDKK